MANEDIARKLMKLYDQGMARDWDMGDIDDVVDKYVPKDSGMTLDKDIEAMPEDQAQAMWKEIEEVERRLDEEDISDEIEEGDLVDFGAYGKLYVVELEAGSSGKYFWVTDQESQRFNPDANGWSILKREAVEILESGADFDPADYKDQYSSKFEGKLAQQMTKADYEAEGYRVEWEPDQDADVSWMDEESRKQHENDERTQWVCLVYNEAGDMESALHGIDLGHLGHPDSSPYAKEVELELLKEVYDSKFEGKLAQVEQWAEMPDDEIKKKIKELWNKGHSVGEIEEQLGVSIQWAPDSNISSMHADIAFGNFGLERTAAPSEKGEGCENYDDARDICFDDKGASKDVK